MVDIPKKSGKYGFLDGKSANGLYKEYRAWCKEKNVQPMPFIQWLEWAQAKGMVKTPIDGESLRSDANYSFGNLEQLVVQLPDSELQSIYSQMRQAKSENWDSEKLKGIYGPTSSLMIPDHKVLTRAIGIFESEMMRRNLPIASDTTSPQHTPRIQPKKWIIPVLLVTVGAGLIYVAVKK